MLSLLNRSTVDYELNSVTRWQNETSLRGCCSESKDQAAQVKSEIVIACSGAMMKF